jgi:hypothetical protein
MQWWETISDQWIWLIAAGIFVVFVAALAAYSLNKPKQHDKLPRRLCMNCTAQSLREGWRSLPLKSMRHLIRRAHYLASSSVLV